MNYRHIFHAGNFADVVKHAALALIIEHLKRKSSPFAVIDTHAGAGEEQIHRVGETPLPCDTGCAHAESSVVTLVKCVNQTLLSAFAPLHDRTFAPSHLAPRTSHPAHLRTVAPSHRALRYTAATRKIRAERRTNDPACLWTDCARDARCDRRLFERHDHINR